jgi:hypothetical protein
MIRDRVAFASLSTPLYVNADSFRMACFEVGYMLASLGIRKPGPVNVTMNRGISHIFEGGRPSSFGR